MSLHALPEEAGSHLPRQMPTLVGQLVCHRLSRRSRGPPVPLEVRGQVGGHESPDSLGDPIGHRGLINLSTDSIRPLGRVVRVRAKPLNRKAVGVDTQDSLRRSSVVFRFEANHRGGRRTKLDRKSKGSVGGSGCRRSTRNPQGHQATPTNHDHVDRGLAERIGREIQGECGFHREQAVRDARSIAT